MNLSEKRIEQNFNSLSLWGLQPLVPVDCDLNLGEKIYDALHEVILFLKKPLSATTSRKIRMDP